MVKREDAQFQWIELQPKIIAVLLETYSMPKANIHLDNISLSWDKMDALIDNIITLGLTPLMQTTHSGKESGSCQPAICIDYLGWLIFRCHFENETLADTNSTFMPLY